MHHSNGPETLILFARPPQPGRVKTRLIPALGNEGAAELYRAFLSDAALLATKVREARPSVALTCEWAMDAGDRLEDYPVSSWLPGPFLHRRQEGTHLGSRMAAALGRSLARGRRAVLIGTDFPDLAADILHQAFDTLRGATEPDSGGGDFPRAVLGPAEDGGYYLIGLNRHCPEVFEEISWGTPEVFALTYRKLNTLSYSMQTVPKWRDVDGPEDLASLRARLASAPPDLVPNTREALGI